MANKWAGIPPVPSDSGTQLAALLNAVIENLRALQDAASSKSGGGGSYTLPGKLQAIVDLTWAAGNFMYFTGTAAVASTGITTWAMGLLTKTTAAAAQAYILSSKLQAIDTLTWAANQVMYFTGAGSVAATSLTSWAIALLGKSTASDARIYLGLNNINTNFAILSKPTAGALLNKRDFVWSETWPANLAGSNFYTDTPATGSYAITVKKNGSAVATITFSAGANTGTATTTGGAAINWVNTDRADWYAPATADATFNNAVISILGSWT